MITTPYSFVATTHALWWNGIKPMFVDIVFDEIPGVKRNYSYFPIFIDAEKYGMSRDALYEKMKSQDVLGRRYFYPPHQRILHLSRSGECQT